MTTTFQNRKLVLNELATLATATNTWQAVYDYYPGFVVLNENLSSLVIRGRASNQQFSNANTNPVSYMVSLQNWVLAYDENLNWSSQNGEDAKHDLDVALRQLIRNNAGAMTTCTYMFFEGDSVSVDYSPSQPLMVETYQLRILLPAGAV